MKPISDTLKCLSERRPLSSDQINFLSQHEKTLGIYVIDSDVQHYLEYSKKHLNQVLPMVFPKTIINYLIFHRIKQWVKILLKNKLMHVHLNMSLKQFMQFKMVGMNELIFWHGNQFLTGAPFYPGGIPTYVFFQWGNLFGVVKYNIVSGEKAVLGNLLICIEEMHERYFSQCIADYTHQLKSQEQARNEGVRCHPLALFYSIKVRD